MHKYFFLNSNKTQLATSEKKKNGQYRKTNRKEDKSKNVNTVVCQPVKQPAVYFALMTQRLLVPNKQYTQPNYHFSPCYTLYLIKLDLWVISSLHALPGDGIVPTYLYLKHGVFISWMKIKWRKISIDRKSILNIYNIFTQEKRIDNAFGMFAYFLISTKWYNYLLSYRSDIVKVTSSILYHYIIWSLVEKLYNISIKYYHFLLVPDVLNNEMTESDVLLSITASAPLLQLPKHAYKNLCSYLEQKDKQEW